MENYDNFDLIVFDLDGTLAESKSSMDQEMAELLRKLLERKKVAVISGGAFHQFEKQFLKSLEAGEKHLVNLYLFPTCGSRFFRNDGSWSEVYRHELGEKEKKKIMSAFEVALEEIGYEHPQEPYGEIIEDRGTQITFSALGQLAPGEYKNKWDPDQKKRLEIKLHLDKKLSDFEVRIGGSTSIDVTKKGIDKAYGISQMEKYLSVPKERMLFIGDAIFPGGNDYAVLEAGVQSHGVSGPKETKELINKLLELLQ